MDNDILKQVDEFAKANGTNRTAAVHILINQALDYKKMIDNIPDMMAFYSQNTKKSI